MRNFVEELKARLRKIDGHTEPIKAPREDRKEPTVVRYNLYSVFGGQRKTVGFYLTIDEAEVLKQVALKRLLKLPEPDAGGSPLFELTELLTERVLEFGKGIPKEKEIDWK